ncbi:hypothetical protein FS935_12720 [Metabacillus litoralis]|uniref:NAD(P)-dependent oxidoreductase n=1 Tax=Metabacillus litoralis TaxID=152268 RepID=A0A5C6W4M5_9BACI|nr:hypothetical protein [Metabacillus litoralis]TXC90766.1 hypothetical protein FS935_12720 [Metabacillus litoralis]
MIQRVIIFGAQTYFGISLCERLLEEGIEVKAVLFDRGTSETRDLVEDRLLYIGRNALLEINDSYYRESEEDRDVDFIIFCGEEDHHDEFELLQDSIKTANHLNSRFLYINSHHVHNEYQELVEILKEHSILILPTIYGASLSRSNKINKALIQYLKNEKQEIVIEDHVLPIKDAVEATYNLLENVESKFYTFSMKKDLNPENSLPIRFVEDKQNLNKKIKGLCTIEVESSISIEEGLQKQISDLKKENKNED